MILQYFVSNVHFSAVFQVYVLGVLFSCPSSTPMLHTSTPTHSYTDRSYTTRFIQTDHTQTDHPQPSHLMQFGSCARNASVAPFPFISTPTDSYTDRPSTTIPPDVDWQLCQQRIRGCFLSFQHTSTFETKQKFHSHPT